MIAMTVMTSAVMGVCAPRAALAVVPSELAARWQPLRPRSGDPTYGRPELKRAWRDHGKARYARSCKAVEALRARLMRKASALFYKPVRKGADLGGIEAFMQRYVRGKAPLLQIAHEVFVPSAGLRNLAVDTCARAGKPDIASRFLDQAALSGTEARLRVALAVTRMASGSNAAEVRWLVGERGGGARAVLLRAIGAPGALVKRYVQQARARAGLAERADIEVVIGWLRKHSSPAKSRQ